MASHRQPIALLNEDHLVVVATGVIIDPALKYGGVEPAQDRVQVEVTRVCAKGAVVLCKDVNLTMRKNNIGLEYDRAVGPTMSDWAYEYIPDVSSSSSSNPEPTPFPIWWPVDHVEKQSCVQQCDQVEAATHKCCQCELYLHNLCAANRNANYELLDRAGAPHHDQSCDELYCTRCYWEMRNSSDSRHTADDGEEGQSAAATTKPAAAAAPAAAPAAVPVPVPVPVPCLLYTSPSPRD